MKSLKNVNLCKRAVAIIVAMLMILPSAFLLGSCGAKNEGDGKGAAFVAIDINPTVELTLDKNGRVLTVYAANEDAEVMLYQSSGIVGEKVADAAQRIAELAKEYGYVTEENSTVSVTVSADTDKLAEDIYNGVKTNMETALSAIGAKVAECADAVTEARLNALKKQYADNEAIADMDVEKYRLVRSAMLADRGLSVTEAAAMTVEELSALVTAKREERKEMLSRAMEMAVENAQLIYGQTKANIVNTVYLKYGGTEAVRYAALDNAYFAVSLMIKVNGDLAEFGITEAAVRELAANIGIPVEKIDEFVADCKDSEGYITDETIAYAVNKWYRNMTEAARAAADAYMPQLVEKLEEFAVQVSTLSSTAVSAFNAVVTPLKLIANIELDFSIKTYDDMATFAEALRAAADDSMAKILSSLTEEQKGQLDEELKTVDASLTEAEKTLNAAIDKARADAEAFLKAAQERRRSNV